MRNAPTNPIIILALLLGGPILALPAEDLTPPPRFLKDETVARLWADMAPASADDIRGMGLWQQQTLGYVPRESLRTATLEVTLPLLQAAVAQGMSALEFFADPAWRGDQAMFVPGKVLSRLADHFDLRGVFVMRGKDVDGKTVQMEWLILGRSQMIIKYDRTCTVHHPDYDYYTGKYEYRRFVHMNVGLHQGQVGIFNIKGANRPEDKLEWLQGPLDADVKHFIMVNGRKLRCEYSKIVGQEELVPLYPIRELDAQGGQDSQR